MLLEVLAIGLGLVLTLLHLLLSILHCLGLCHLLLIWHVLILRVLSFLRTGRLTGRLPIRYDTIWDWRRSPVRGGHRLRRSWLPGVLCYGLLQPLKNSIMQSNNQMVRLIKQALS